MAWIVLAVIVVVLVAGLYLAVVTGRLTLDFGIGRRVRPLGPISVEISAPPETVFDVIAGPYMRTPRAMKDKLRVWERSEDMVLAEHLTKTGSITTSTVETVGFERPRLVSFRLLRGPVPHVAETYELTAAGDSTEFTYRGEIGADFWILGRLWAGLVGGRWERAVADSIKDIKREAERLAAR